MPNQITSEGLETKTFNEILTELEDGLKGIYGADINLDSDSPDGQLVNIQTQQVIDLLDLVREVYNSFDPDSAIGVTLDRRVAYNGVKRKGGSYTLIDLTVVVNRKVTLNGLDANDLEDSYKVSDDAGNEFALVDTVTLDTAGTYLLRFRASEIGQVETVINTITNPVDILIAVDSVTNDSGAVTVGEDQEDDFTLKIRRSRSTSIGATGYYEALRANLEQLDGITSAQVYENKKNEIDSRGIPAHGIWVIVSGTATDESIGTAIYEKRNGGLDMRGEETYDYNRPDGSIFTIQWDEAEPQDLWAIISVRPINPSIAILETEIVNGLPDIFQPDIGASANINDLTAAVSSIDPNALVISSDLSVNGSFYEKIVSPDSLNKQLTLATARIDLTVL